MSARKSLLLILLLLTAGVMLVSCGSTPNYLDESGPRYTGAYGVEPANYDGAPKIITWNIQYAQDIDGAIETLSTSPQLQEADAILLQEMDENGTEAIARALHLNYVYYPASVHVNTRRDFGEAILSPWPLTNDAKIILPHESVRNGQIRIAVRAQVQTPHEPFLAYSVHTEMALMSPAHRIDQVKAMLDDVPDDAPFVIIGGDFNTVTPIERKALVDMMAEKEFVWLTEGAGASVKELGVGVIMDYIFARGFSARRMGVVDSEASDHLPLWVETEKARFEVGK